MEHIIKIFFLSIDVSIVPIIFFTALLMKLIRIIGVQRLPLCRFTLMQVGVFPIRNHYYEPLFDSRLLRYPLNQDRILPGLNWNIQEQIHLLNCFDFNEELNDVPDRKVTELSFHFNNGSFESGDAEYLYNLIRLKKPKKIIEIGSGNSTLMAIKAIKMNQEEDSGFKCGHTCIEPYEMPWLEKTGVTVIRQRVEEVNKAIFYELEQDDILFIDSSHIIRPQGDVLFEYLELMPALKVGVIVHIHDIFTPRDYLQEWVVDNIWLWNEQYLLEAFLTCNKDWKIIGALNYLHHNYYQKLKATCPFLAPDREPGSFYIQRIAH